MEIEMGVIRKTTGAFTWLDTAWNLLVREPACGGKFLDEVPVEISVFDEHLPVKILPTADGIRTEIQPSKT